MNYSLTAIYQGISGLWQYELWKKKETLPIISFLNGKVRNSDRISPQHNAEYSESLQKVYAPH